MKGGRKTNAVVTFGSKTNSTKPGGFQRLIEEEVDAHKKGGHDKVHDAPKKKKMGKPT